MQLGLLNSWTLWFLQELPVFSLELTGPKVPFLGAADPLSHPGFHVQSQVV